MQKWEMSGNKQQMWEIILRHFKQNVCTCVNEKEDVGFERSCKLRAAGLVLVEETSGVSLAAKRF